MDAVEAVSNKGVTDEGITNVESTCRVFTTDIGCIMVDGVAAGRECVVNETVCL